MVVAATDVVGAVNAGVLTVTVAVAGGVVVGVTRGGVGVLVVGACVVVGGGPVSPGLLPHPVPPLGTKLIAGSFPLYSDFKLGKFAGRRAEGTFPKVCMPPWRRDAVFLCWFGSEDSP